MTDRETTTVPPTCASIRERLTACLERKGDLAFRCVGRTGAILNGLLGSPEDGHIGVLTYHRVFPKVPTLPAPEHNVTPAAFRRQMQGLLDRGYQFISLERLIARRSTGRPFPPRTAVVTFDDGYQSVYTCALPILQELEIPATVFVSTSFLDGEWPFPFDAWGTRYYKQLPPTAYLPLTTDQCRAMLASGLIELGAHTHTHEDFRDRPAEFEADLKTSVDILRDRFALEPVTFAFPFGCPYRGFAGADLKEAARRTNVTCGLTTEAITVNPQGNPFCWGRFNVFPWDTGATLAAKLAGWYSWAPKLRRRGSRFLRGWFSAARLHVRRLGAGGGA